MDIFKESYISYKRTYFPISWHPCEFAHIQLFAYGRCKHLVFVSDLDNEPIPVIKDVFIVHHGVR